jgi:hypothetical protein
MIAVGEHTHVFIGPLSFVRVQTAVATTCVILGVREREQRDACLSFCFHLMNYANQNRNRSKTETRHTGELREIVRSQSRLRRLWY